MSRRILGPFNRVEGELEIQLEVEAGRVREARVTSSLYRGFEQILQGKDPRDALVYTPRICGICSVSQSVASAAALADCQGVTMPPNGELAVNLILASENVADHLSHFYLFFMPDFARQDYAGEAWHAVIAARFQALSGSAARRVLPARAQFLRLMGLLAGKWPHSLAIQPGGSTRAIEAQEQARILAILFDFRRFLETELFGDSLENIVALDSLPALREWAQQHPWTHCDLRRFLRVADDLRLARLGRGGEAFMSFGAYAHAGRRLFPRGLWRDGSPSALDPARIREDLSHGWMAHRDAPRHPFEGVTAPDAEAADGYSWCKAPRLDGQVMEVGALARQVVDGHPLVRDLVRRDGGNVRNRVIARLLEIARVLLAMEDWARELQPAEPFCRHAPMPEEAEGCGMMEAARGSLGHWVRLRNGRILNYQIIAPTTWNFSPRDGRGEPGALERALIGAPVGDDERDPVAVQHIVRSFDPCMVCTAH